MLNLEQLLSRIGAIVRHPRDQAAQLMLMFPTMDIVGDSFTASNGIGQLMTPSRIRKRIAAIEEHVPDRIKRLVMAPAYRALAAAEQVADEFFVSSPNPDATTESRLTTCGTRAATPPMASITTQISSLSAAAARRPTLCLCPWFTSSTS
ncbi:MAG: hypothetical protein JWR32_4962 [Mycobacterium sp.]|jgi:hypothetical protein|nr:hypothetical protein [Mycobacterium sp.]